MAVDGGRRWGRNWVVSLKLKFVIRINQRLLIRARNDAIVTRNSIILIMNKHHA
jgi:hypothetical protein